MAAQKKGVGFMRDIEVQGLGRLQIPDQWTDVEIKLEVLRLKNLPCLTVDHTNESNPIVTGDADALKPVFDAYCKWGEDGFWHAEPRHVESIRQAARSRTFRLIEILPKPEPKKPAAKEAVAPKATQPAGKREANTPAEPTVVTGIIEQAATESGKSPRVSVLLKIDKTKHWMSAFDTALFGFLIAGKGQEAELFVTKVTKGDKTFTNIVGLKRVGSKHFDSDMKTPIIQNREREAGGRTLFP
jgi:hypothetical protein